MGGRAVIVLLCLLAGKAMAQDENLRVIVDDPYIELHTGPGRGYPIFYIGERGEEVEVLKRRTEWFQVRVERDKEGWVHLEQLQRTFNLDGERFDVPGFTFGDYRESRWEVGALYGDFGGANVIAAFGGFSVTENLSLEINVSQALGRFSDSQLVSLNVVHLMFPDRRWSPFFTLGAGSIRTEPKATLVSAIDRRDSMALAGAGFRVYLTRRFVFRTEYKTYVAFTSRDDNEEISEWKAGFSFFF
ncbi:MAG: SH3 domain-containing protein [Gammaproteobacteria bacterium]|jgi:hypothetical protein